MMGPTARFEYCFIITYGRSGSTLLQGVLNTIPGYLIRGENAGVVSRFCDIVTSSSYWSAREGWRSGAPMSPFFGMDGIDRGALLDDLRGVFVRNYLRPSADTRCLGFKEVRYGPLDVPDMDDMLTFMTELFPGACFVFNSRNLADTATSDIWCDTEGAYDYLQMFEAEMRTAYEKRPDHAYWVRYEDYVGDPGTLQGLFDFLDEPLDLGRIRAIMRYTHAWASQRSTPSAPIERGSGERLPDRAAWVEGRTPGCVGANWVTCKSGCEVPGGRCQAYVTRLPEPNT